MSTCPTCGTFGHLSGTTDEWEPDLKGQSERWHASYLLLKKENAKLKESLAAMTKDRDDWFFQNNGRYPPKDYEPKYVCSSCGPLKDNKHANDCEALKSGLAL